MEKHYPNVSCHYALISIRALLEGMRGETPPVQVLDLDDPSK